MNRKAAKLVAPRKFEMIQEPIRPLQDNEVLLRVLSCGLCHSDFPAYHGESRIARTPDGIPYMDTNCQTPSRWAMNPPGIVEEVGKAVQGIQTG